MIGYWFIVPFWPWSGDDVWADLDFWSEQCLDDVYVDYEYQNVWFKMRPVDDE